MPGDETEPPTSNEVSTLLRAWSEDGEQSALDQLTPVVYAELRRLAHRQMDRSALATVCRRLRSSTKHISAWSIATGCDG